MWTHRKVSVKAKSAIDGAVERNDEVDSGCVQRGEVTRDSNGVVEGRSHGAVEIDADAAVEGRHFPGLRAGEGIVEEIRLESCVGERNTPVFGSLPSENGATGNSLSQVSEPGHG